MTLKIKDKDEKDDIIELEEGLAGVLVKINGELIAIFDHDGEFEFFGNEDKPQFAGRWK